MNKDGYDSCIVCYACFIFCVIIAMVPTDDGLGGSLPITTMIIYRFLIIYLGV